MLIDYKTIFILII